MSGKHEVLYRGDLPWEVRDRHRGTQRKRYEFGLLRNLGVEARREALLREATLRYTARISKPRGGKLVRVCSERPVSSRFCGVGLLCIRLIVSRLR